MFFVSIRIRNLIKLVLRSVFLSDISFFYIEIAVFYHIDCFFIEITAFLDFGHVLLAQEVLPIGALGNRSQHVYPIYVAGAKDATRRPTQGYWGAWGIYLNTFRVFSWGARDATRCPT